VFDYDGSLLPGLPVASLGLSQSTSWAAFAPGSTPSLLLADVIGCSPRLVAVDPATRSVRWRSAAGSLGACDGIAALPSLGVVVTGSDESLFAHRLSDGSRVGSLEVPGLWLYLAADSAAGIVYGTTYDHIEVTVHAWSCVADGAGVRISRGMSVGAAGSSKYSRTLAIVPPAPGKRVSHLVVGSRNSSELVILSLPGLAFVHSHNLEGMQVTGLAADPWGAALAACDRVSGAIHVLGWPLPGMPPLE